jgi:hypothetical protein
MYKGRRFEFVREMGMPASLLLLFAKPIPSQQKMTLLTRLLVLMALFRPFALAYPWMAGEGVQSR